MASTNRKCLLCGEPYHCCGSCDLPSWAWTYCCEECWSASFRGIACLALGAKLAQVLEPYELAILKEGIEEESHYLDKIVEGTKLSRD